MAIFFPRSQSPKIRRVSSHSNTKTWLDIAAALDLGISYGISWDILGSLANHCNFAAIPVHQRKYPKDPGCIEVVEVPEKMAVPLCHKS